MSILATYLQETIRMHWWRGCGVVTGKMNANAPPILKTGIFLLIQNVSMTELNKPSVSKKLKQNWKIWLEKRVSPWDKFIFWSRRLSWTDLRWWTVAVSKGIVSKNRLIGQNPLNHVNSSELIGLDIIPLDTIPFPSKTAFQLVGTRSTTENDVIRIFDMSALVRTMANHGYLAKILPWSCHDLGKRSMYHD